MAGLGHDASRRAGSVDHGPIQQLRDSSERMPAPDAAPASRAGKLFLLAPRMLLARTLHGAQGRKELLARAAAFHGLPTGRMGAVASSSTATQSAV